MLEYDLTCLNVHNGALTLDFQTNLCYCEHTNTVMVKFSTPCCG